jgi:hypothetical protein
METRLLKVQGRTLTLPLPTVKAHAIPTPFLLRRARAIVRHARTHARAHTRSPRRTDRHRRVRAHTHTCTHARMYT